MSRHVWALVAGVLLLALPAVAAEPPPAASPDAADAAPDAATRGGLLAGWEFEVAPYAWLTANYGTLDVNGRTAHVSLTLHDVLDLATGGNAFTAGGYFSARHDRWSTFVDAFGGYADLGATTTVPTPRCNLDVAGKLKMKPVIVDFGVGYELGRWSLPALRRPLSLGVYAGMRYTWIYQRLRASASVPSLALRQDVAASATVDWADPMIGVRWEVPILDSVSFDFRADVGGFGASSDLIWGIASGARLWLPWNPMSLRPWLGIGYRIVAFDHPFGDGLKTDLQFRGPTSALGFAF